MCRSSTTGSRPWQQPVVPLGLSRTSLCVPPATRIAIQPRSGGTMLPWASAHGSRDTNPTKAPTGRHEPQNSPKTGPSICSASCQNGAIHLCRVVISDFPALTYTNHDHQNSLRRSEQSCPPECARCRLARHPPCSLPIPQPADKSPKNHRNPAWPGQTVVQASHVHSTPFSRQHDSNRQSRIRVCWTCAQPLKRHPVYDDIHSHGRLAARQTVCRR